MVSKELSHIIANMAGLDKATMGAMKNMGAFKTAVVGIGAMAFGAGILAGMYKISEAGGELTKQLGQLKMQYGDLSDAQMNSVKQYALKTSVSSNVGVTPSEVVEGVKENMTIFKDFGEAMGMTDTTTRVKGAISASLNKSFEDADKDYKNLIKSVELHGDTVDPKTGQFSVSRATAALEDKEKMMVSTAGMATSNDILAVEKQGSVVLRTMGYEQADRFEAGLIQVFGGARAGTALNAFGQQFFGGKMSEANANEMIKMGLMNQGGYTKRKGGGIDVKAGGLVGQDLLDKGDIAGYFAKYMNPRLHEAYEKHGRPGEKESVFMASELAKMVATGTDRRLINEFASQMLALKKEGQGIDHVQSMDDQIKTGRATSIDANVKMLGAAWEGFEQALGLGMVPTVITALQGLTAGIKFFTAEIIKHPTITKIMMEITAGIGALLVVFGAMAAIGGAILLIAAIPAAPIIAAVVGITAAIGILGVVLYASWGHIKKWGAEFGAWAGKQFSTIVQMHVDFWNKLVMPFVSSIATKIASVWTTFQTALTGFFNKFIGFFASIGTWISSHIPHFMGGGGPAGPVNPDHFKYDPSGSGGGSNTPVNLNIDGKKVAQIVLDHAGKAMSGNNTGQTGFNTRQAPQAPGNGGLM